MVEFLQNLLQNLTVPICMNEKEKDIQEALGLLKTYDGYVKAQGNTYFDVYEVQDVTLAGAKQQIDAIVAKLQQESKVLLNIYFVQENMNDDDSVQILRVRRHNAASSNPKS